MKEELHNLDILMLVSLVRYSVLQVIVKRLGERKKYSEKVRRHKGLTI